MPPKLSSAQTIHVIGGRTFHIPAGGWDAEQFVRHGAGMIRAMSRVAKITQRKAIPVVAKTAKELFDTQLKRIIRRVEQQRQHFRFGLRSLGSMKADSGPTSVLLSMPQEEQLWAEAIAEVLKTADIEVVVRLTPPIQSVMAQGYSKTAYMLGQRADAQVAAAISQQTRETAKQITAINDTTQKNILNAVKDGVKQQMTVRELSEYIEQRESKIFGNRALTIARTELNKAWTQGAAISFKESDAITQYSVIGCEAREASSPHFKGQSTCNYKGIKKDELDEFLAVGFHPNHTGTLIPSGFASDAATEAA
jgi:hypothetical protein